MLTPRVAEVRSRRVAQPAAYVAYRRRYPVAQGGSATGKLLMAMGVVEPRVRRKIRGR